MRRAASFPAWLVVAALACGGDEAATSAAGTSTGGVDGCLVGQLAAGQGVCCEPGSIPAGLGVCSTPGLPADLACPPGAWPSATGCEQAGVPPTSCGEGFVADGARGCTPVLPPGRCGAGTTAVVGDATCRAIALCGRSKYGDIPTDATTVHVDLNYDGVGNDGSATRPYTSIAAALGAAAAGATIAIAAGVYQEAVLIRDKPVRLRGRCPSQVEIAGDGVSTHGLLVETTAASGTEVRGVALTRRSEIRETSGVVLDEVWVHDIADGGLTVTAASGVVIRRSLLEDNAPWGVLAAGAELTVEESLVRRSAQVGVLAQSFKGTTPPLRATLALRGSVVEDHGLMAVSVVGGAATLERAVIRDHAGGTSRRGLQVRYDEGAGDRAQVTVSASVLSHNREVAVLLAGADLTLDGVVIDDTLPVRPAGIAPQVGMGLVAQVFADGAAAPGLTVRRSRLSRNVVAGVLVSGGTAVLEGVAIDDTLAGDDFGFGVGVGVVSDALVGAGRLQASGSAVQRAQGVGVLVLGSEATLDASWVDDPLPGTAAVAQGVHASGGTLLLRDSLVERAREAAVVMVGGQATLQRSVVRTTRSTAGGDAGDGVVVLSRSTDARASALLQDTAVSDHHRFGVVSFGATVVVQRVVATCNQIDLAGVDVFLGGTQPFAFDDEGGTGCGCAQEYSRCTAQPTNAVPPTTDLAQLPATLPL